MKRRARAFGFVTFFLVGATQVVPFVPARADGQLPSTDSVVEEVAPVISELPSQEDLGPVVGDLPSQEDLAPVLDDDVNVPSGGGGTIAISVYGDLSACATVSFRGIQLEAAGTLSAVGAASHYDGAVTQVSNADNDGGTNLSSLEMCVPGGLYNAAEVTFQANAAGFTPNGIVTTMSATTTCVYWQVGGLSCTPQATVVTPPATH